MYTFIVNPIAGRGKPKKCMENIEEYLNVLKIPFKVYYTNAPDHATEIAKELSGQDVKAVVAVGGDGTVAEVAAGLMDTDCPMGIIPAGTGNDYRRNFGIPDDIIGAVDVLLQENIKQVDTVTINGQTFLNIITVGFDVEVVKRAERYKVFGQMAYTLGAIEGAFWSKPNKAKFTIDDEEFEKEFLLFAAGCGAYYGGGMNPLPGANPFDGMLDFCMIDSVSSLKILKLLPKYKAGQHTDLEMAHFDRARRIVIDSEKPLTINADGDILPEQNRIEYQVVPNNLNVLARF